MCLVFISYKIHPSHRFVIAGNRDEFFKRPTAQLNYIGSDHKILGGQDLQQGGMWLGVRRNGKNARFGVITNYRQGLAKTAERPSRGDIVMEYLTSDASAIDTVTDLAKRSESYAGFNVLFGDEAHLVFFSNAENRVRVLEPGFYGLSNHLLDSPWPKVLRGKELLQSSMCGPAEINIGRIIQLLQDKQVPADEELPDTGVGLHWERFLAPVFIEGADYGTRSSAVVQIGYDGQVYFAEKSYLRQGEQNTTLFKQMSL
jgi:uncharacterized protein with NRDE domain